MINSNEHGVKFDGTASELMCEYFSTGEALYKMLNPSQQYVFMENLLKLTLKITKYERT